MKCPKCKSVPPEGAKFCNACGNKLEIACPECGKANSPASRFCIECGYNLTSPSEPPPKELSFDEKIDKIQRYLPKGLAEKILAQKDKIEGERKQVTVMFCDLEGFTPMVESLGPEEAYSIMDQVYEILIHKVHDFEGTVNEMTGDGVMALFGAPIALEDAPQRAIRVAMAIHREMSKFSDKLKQEKAGLPILKMRIGIHTGPVVVGTLGNDLRVEFKAVGDTVNLASRMEGLAEPGATYITEDTFKLTEGFFRFEALGERAVKGKKDPVRIYRVIAPSSRRTRFDVSAERGLTPFIARARELELLLDGFERSKAGSGRAFSIVSEAGVGKSRFLYEFRKAVINEDITFLEGRCLSYSKGAAYHPVIDILKSNFNIQENDNDSEIRDKIINGLSILDIDEASTLPYLLELLSVKDSGIDKIPMSPQAKKEQIMESVKRIAIKGSELKPLVIAIEDLHWIDKSSEECLKNLLNSISVACILLIFTYRTEYVPIWGGRSYHSQITLNRLSNQESLAVVTHLMGTDDIVSDIGNMILEKTEGVPFFIEEFIKSLKDLKIIEEKKKTYHLAKDFQDITIPSTIQDVIMARVDSLPEGAKELLQTGSVIEREFSYELIKLVTGLSGQELLSHLSALKDSELLYEKGIYPESTYIFKHALTQEVIFDSILTKRKKKLHAKIGTAIEELFKENINQHYGVLSGHFINSENYEKGAEYSKLAGRMARKRSAFSDAISYAQKTIFCLEKFSNTDAVQKKIIDARTSLAAYCVVINLHVAAKEAVAPIVDLAVNLNYQKKLPIIYVSTGSFSIYVEEDYPKGFEDLQKAIKISEETGDFFSYWLACYFLGGALCFNCDFEKGISFLIKSLDLSKTINEANGIVVAKGTMSVIGYAFQGKIDLAFKTSEESLHLARESGDIHFKGMALSTFGMCCFYKGLFKKAENVLLEAVDLCGKTMWYSWGGWANLFLGEIFFDRGDYKKARDHYNQAILFGKKTGGFHSWHNLFEINIARIRMINKFKNFDLKLMNNYMDRNNLKCLDGWTKRLFGDIWLNLGIQHISKAEEWIQKAIDADKKNGMMFELARDYALYANLIKRKNNIPKAQENLIKAINIFKKCGADGWVEKYEKEMAAM
ncbi:MAG: AAA family ATPase [Desulfobacteraceae bacterium]|nr:AAA family ATPase [Desulfobacteraceae bacterium]MBC2753924.1 AAA family ATPase [Desulfobacteraceae bacterium]